MIAPFSCFACGDGNGFGLWDTVLSRDHKGSPDQLRPENSRPLNEQVKALWPTPLKSDATQGDFYLRGNLTLKGATKLWPTVTCSDGGSNNGSESVKTRGHGTNLQGAITLWPTLLSSDAEKGSPKQPGSKGDWKLPGAVTQLWPTPDSYKRGGAVDPEDRKSGGHAVSLQDAATLWPTPTVTGNYNRAGISEKSGDGLATAAQTAFGSIENSSSAETERFGQLNPDFAEWLMGWPIGWTGSAPLEMDRFQSWLPRPFRSSPES